MPQSELHWATGRYVNAVLCVLGVSHSSFDHWMLRKIIETVATRCLKCTKYNLSWGFAPNPAGSLTSLPRPSSSISSILLQKKKKENANRRIYVSGGIRPIGIASKGSEKKKRKKEGKEKGKGSRPTIFPTLQFQFSRNMPEYCSICCCYYTRCFSELLTL